MSELPIYDWEGGATSFNDLRYACQLADKLGMRVRYPRGEREIIVSPGENPHKLYKVLFPEDGG